MPRAFSFPLFVLGVFIAAGTAAPAAAAVGVRARDLGIPFEGTPGPLNAITDVPGVEVGHRTLVRGSGKRKPGRGPVRTGVTALFPRGKGNLTPVFGGWFSLNGNGELTGTAWIDEMGTVDGPILFTNTHSVGVVRDAVVKWWGKRKLDPDTTPLPVVGETWDGYLNDIEGQHVTTDDALKAMDDAKGGPVAEGNVGGGTGMICYEYKGGIGTASRVVMTPQGKFTLGVLVQANFGLRHQLRLGGVPLGRRLGEEDLVWSATTKKETGSLLIAIGTDAPLLPHQLKRLARRAGMGIARLGSVSGDSSGDLFLAFSTGGPTKAPAKGAALTAKYLPNAELDGLFTATVESVEEAVVNALVAAETMEGGDGRKVVRLPVEKVRALLGEHKLLTR